MSAPPAIHDLNDQLKSWLFERVLPLWWEVGADHERGGFVERIDLEGRPVDANRRVRVAARQTWVFSVAGRLGWTGPYREAVEHGVRALTEVYERPNGLYGILADVDGRLLNRRPAPYEQAFCLLALSAAQETLGGDFEARAVRLREAMLSTGIVRPDGGIHDEGFLQANPMMHLFEAVQAWARVGADPGWSKLADTIAETALTRMIDPATGVLREQYAPDWTPRAEADIEPGHQLEWGWLLLAHGSGWDAAQRLIDVAEQRGVERGVAIFSLDSDLAPRDRSARLWAQTERLHAHAAAGQWAALEAGARGLNLFFDVPVPGTWRDRLLPDGTFVEEAAPASSLYHIISAALALDAACRDGM